jgi:hypothetical protein
MKSIIDICKFLDENSNYELSDKLFIKFASSKKDILDKRILIPSDVKKIIKEAYDKRTEDIKFGNNASFELAKEFITRTYIELDKVLEIHEYTVKHRNIYSKSKKHPSYWNYMLHGGPEGKKWASDIIKIYLPKKWKVN